MTDINSSIANPVSDPVHYLTSFASQDPSSYSSNNHDDPLFLALCEIVSSISLFMSHKSGSRPSDINVSRATTKISNIECTDSSDIPSSNTYPAPPHRASDTIPSLLSYSSPLAYPPIPKLPDTLPGPPSHSKQLLLNQFQALINTICPSAESYNPPTPQHLVNLSYNLKNDTDTSNIFNTPTLDSGPGLQINTTTQQTLPSPLNDQQPARDESILQLNLIASSLANRVHVQQARIDSQNALVKSLKDQLQVAASLKASIDSSASRFQQYPPELTPPLPLSVDPLSAIELPFQTSPRDPYLLDKELTKSQNANRAFQKALSEIGEVVIAVAQGDLSKKVTVHAQEMDPEIIKFKETINTMMDQLQRFANEVTKVTKEVAGGALGGQAESEGTVGVWRELTDNVNIMASNLTNQVREIADVTRAVAQGDLSRKINVHAQGEILELQKTINSMVGQLRTFAFEVTRVARETGVEGRLGGQAQIEGVEGIWRELTDNGKYLDSLHALHSSLTLSSQRHGIKPDQPSQKYCQRHHRSRARRPLPKGVGRL